MNKTERWIGMLGLVLSGALVGCTTYGQPSASVGVDVPLPAVEIRADSDFYEPLTPYGRWEEVGSYGRCWIPGRVETGWRPYCSGYWQRSDAGWYWASDEPWAWATYHYGRWDFADRYGWYWVPQTQWAPAWVSWHSGGGYIGWAPLYPANVSVISPRAYVFVQERHFMEPVRPSSVVVNNTTIINQTVINQGPATAVIEKASGRKVQVVAVQELRHKTESAVVTQQKTSAPIAEKKAGSPPRDQAQPAERKAVAARASLQLEKPATAAHQSAEQALKNHEAQTAKPKPVLATANPYPAVNPPARTQSDHPAAVREPARQQTIQHAEPQAKSAKPLDQKIQPSAKERPAASEKSEPTTTDKNHENKGKE
jgi:hypothetical protein